MSKLHDFWCHKVLPLVYDSGLSYYEILTKFVNKLNEVIEWVDEGLSKIPTKTSQLVNDSGFITDANVPSKTSQLVNDSGFITEEDVPTKTSELTNDSGFVDEEEAADAAPVQSVNGQTGDVDTYHYGICSTSAGTALKVVSIPSVTSLNTGLVIHVLFANALTVSSPRLKLNGFSDYAIIIDNTAAPQYWWRSGALLELTFQSNMWTITGGGAASTTYYGKTKLSSSTTSTSTSLAATPAAVKAVKDAIPTKVSELENDVGYITAASDTGWISIPLASNITAATGDGSEAGGGLYYRVVNGNHVYVRGGLNVGTYSGSVITLSAEAIPAAYRPLHTTYDWSICNGRYLGRSYVSATSGLVSLSYVQLLTDTTNTQSANITNFVVNIDYFI